MANSNESYNFVGEVEYMGKAKSDLYPNSLKVINIVGPLGHGDSSIRLVMPENKTTWPFLSFVGHEFAQNVKVTVTIETIRAENDA